MTKDLLSIIRNISIIYKTSIFIMIFLLLGSCFTPLSLSKNIYDYYENSSFTADGQILFAPMYSTTTYLIDINGNINHTWTSSYYPGVSVLWMGDGTIIRTIRVGIGSGGGAGGGVQKVDWDGTVTWDFRYNTNGVLSHHDIKTLPNGNILLIAWEDKTRNEAIAEGRNPNYVSISGMTPDHVIEVEPTGPNSGDIVWEWHVWDHLIQDYDPSKNNYGVVEDHPELVDINYVPSSNIDWTHTNSVDYNEEFDQILLSVHNFNEIWVIDHSTTTAEAAGHTGGNSGKGGDILYRWGNPHAYRAGTTNDRKLFGQHDTSWIKSGYPGEGDILIFNNGVGRGYSTVEEITPPVDENGNYTYTPGTAYGPDTTTWQYIGSPPSSFYSNYVSGAIRLTDDNTIICSGAEGEIFEVTSDGTKLWQYTSPYPNSFMNDIFKVVYIPTEEPPEEYPDLDCEGSLNWDDVSPGATVIGSFDVKNIGTPDSLLDWSIVSYPDWGNWSFSQMSGEGLSPDDGSLTVNVEVVVPNEENSEFEGFVRVENQNDPEDFELIPITLKTPVKIVSIRTLIEFFLEKLQNFFQSGFLYRFFTQKIRDIF